MSFFEDAVSTAKTVGKTVGKRTEEIVIISKKKLSAIELENKLESLYVELGKLYYSILKGQEDNSDRSAELLGDIDKVKNDLEQIRDQINSLTKNK